MFEIGWSELLVIVVVAIVVVGPKELPRLMGTVGHYTGKLRRAAADFQRQFNEAMRETEMAEVKQAMDSVRAETASLNTPVMLPTLDAPQAGASSAAAPASPASPLAAVDPQAPPKPKRARKSAAAAKPKAASAKRGTRKAEPPHDG